MSSSSSLCVQSGKLSCQQDNHVSSTTAIGCVDPEGIHQDLYGLSFLHGLVGLEQQQSQRQELVLIRDHGWMLLCHLLHYQCEQVVDDLYGHVVIIGRVCTR